MTKKSVSIRQWLIVLVALLDDIAILALAVVVLYLLDFTLPLPVLIVIGLVFAVGVFFLHRAIVQSLQRRLVTGAEGMLGAAGVAAEPLNPSGMVIINGEYWKAFSPRVKIEKGRNIEVVGINGLTLEVKERE
jgi:membrane-bound serine protease (ClpP class)